MFGTFAKSVAFLLAALSIASLGASAESQAASLKAGAGRAEIKLPASVFPLGNENFSAVHDPLYARTLVLDDGKSRAAILVLDMTSLFSSTVSEAQATVAKIASVDPSHVWVVASHTFSAPHIGLPSSTTAAQKQKDALLAQALSEAVEASAREAQKSMQPASLGYGSVPVNLNVNRDIQTDQGWWHGHNESGPSDKELAVVKILGSDGSPLAILFNYAVQSSIMNESTGKDGSKEITGDLAGAASRYIERQYSDKAVALFLIGAAGDQEPYFTANRYVEDKDGHSSRVDIHEAGYTLVDLLGERLGVETVRLAQTILPSAPASGLSMQAASVECDGQAMSRDLSALKPRTAYSYQKADKTAAPYWILKLGDIAIAGVQVELSSATGLDFKWKSPIKKTMLVTMVNGAAKYMADSASYDRYTYEAMNSMYWKGSAETLEAAMLSSLGAGEAVLAPHVKSLGAITDIFGDGQKVSSVVLEYDAAIDGGSLEPSDFSVVGKTVTKVYASSKAEPGFPEKLGNYVIVQLNTAIEASRMPSPPPAGSESPANAAPSPSSMPAAGGPGHAPQLGDKATDSPTPSELTARITQIGPVLTVDGKSYAASQIPMDTAKTIDRGMEGFKQFVFTDAQRKGKTLAYNLFIPKDYDPSKKYPLVLFMHDAGQISNNPIRTLTQGLGAVVWASPQDQAKHPAFVLAPQYTAVMTDDNGQTTEDIDVTVDLIKSLESQYSIDVGRLYNTGQSMGGMASIVMDIRYPSLFAASFLVACQWDASKVSPMARKPLWIVVSEGDSKAKPGMDAITQTLAKLGSSVHEATWNAEGKPEDLASEAAQMIAAKTDIKFTVFKGGDHGYTWQHAYSIEGIRDWLFTQSR